MFIPQLMLSSARKFLKSFCNSILFTSTYFYNRYKFPYSCTFTKIHWPKIAQIPKRLRNVALWYFKNLAYPNFDAFDPYMPNHTVLGGI